MFAVPRLFSLPRGSLGNMFSNAFKRFTNVLGNLRSTIGNYIELVVLLVLAPTILAFWASFKQAVDQQYQQIIEALTIVLVLGIAVAAIEKVQSE